MVNQYCSYLEAHREYIYTPKPKSRLDYLNLEVSENAMHKTISYLSIHAFKTFTPTITPPPSESLSNRKFTKRDALLTLGSASIAVAWVAEYHPCAYMTFMLGAGLGAGIVCFWKALKG